MYGQTEATARLSCLLPQFLDTKCDSVGKAIPGVELRVVDDLGEEVPVGETGEIAALGDNITLGYWRAPEESARTFRDGVLYTGDIARVDEDGFLYIVDRASDFLKVGGERVSCRRIEERLLKCDELLEVAVVGRPDEVLGESVAAFVVPETPRPGLEQRVMKFSKETMPPQLVPREVVVMDALPKNSAGKLNKTSLRKQVEASL
jgi:acyl-coenzyme A synthetase/AMP-(fatty) acid ligase